MFELGLLPIDVLFTFMSLQRKMGLMGGLPSKESNEQWSSCGDKAWYWSRDGSGVAIGFRMMGWLVRYGWCSMDGTSRVFQRVFCTLDF